MEVGETIRGRINLRPGNRIFQLIDGFWNEMYDIIVKEDMTIKIIGYGRGGM